ncbi:four helix bundle protein [Mucilaginibacter gracilis]|uniref:Four helix bundle protein n=1 Tax=Mucilaginibacter gracilis TaxID=423350 RepID=A0A495IY98_9SPHI|nr:four helix bundle protein [Mucilaginibacter gracilis]RKR81696.1 four helix bundle protein [Mucilaginibacter gracilis]
MHNIRELKVWNKAIDLAVKVYKISADFPSDERFGLISQTRRSSVSIPSNISEGAGRNTNGEFKQFLGIANGSSYELQTQMVIANRLGFIDTQLCDEVLDNIDEIQKTTYNLQKTLNK